MLRKPLVHALWAALLPAWVSAASPALTIDQFHNGLVETMNQSAKLKCEGRTQRLAPLVDTTFDLPFIAERALRKHWKTLGEAERSRFVATLRDSVIGTYATEFATPGSVQFSTGKPETLPSGDVLVRTTLSPKSGQAVSLEYLLKARGEGYQIVNVLAEGVSDLALRASQYDAIMKSEGFASLEKKLIAQNSELRSRCK